MSSPRIGSLFAGYGGLDMAVQQVYGGDLAWYADCCKFDKDGNAGHHEPHRAPCSIMAHHHPDVPNLGDVTKVDWAAVEPIDILTGGSPCQDLSHAGRRAGMTEGTRSNLWVAMREAIAQLRPARVIWENVRGAFSAAAASAVEPCPGCVGDGSGVHLRALGRVLGDLSDLGYDCRAHGLRAADVGAPHGRFRVFVVATDASGLRRGAGWPAGPSQAEGGRPLGHLAGRGDESLTLLGTPRVTSSGMAPSAEMTARGETKGRLEQQIAMLPTPRATDGTKGGPGQRGSSGDLMLPSAVALLPTPRALDATGVRGVTPNRPEASNYRAGETLSDIGYDARWGDYAAAIARWEHILGRPAPEPTQTSSKGNPQLSPAFVEWMMGLPAGWVTDVPGITRNEALKALGNGVVPQQAAEALRVMATWTAVAA